MLRDCRAGQQLPQHADEGFISLATSFLSRCQAQQMTQIRYAPEKRKHISHISLDLITLRHRYSMRYFYAERVTLCWCTAVVSLSHKLRDQLLLSQRPQRGVLPLRTAIAAFTTSPGLITPLHADLFLL